MNKKKLILIGATTILLMILIIFIVGRSFGFFRYIKEGEIVNIITISGIKVDVLNLTDDALNLENAYPIYDSEGLNLTPFQFSVTNTSKKNLNYTIKIENDAVKHESCTLEDGTTCPILTTNYIKFVYKKDDGTYSEPKLLSSTNGIISSGKIKGGETLTSSVILWIDSEAGNEIQNHYFFGKLLITGEQQTVLTFADTIIKNNTLIEAEPTLTTSSNNTTDASGLYKSTLTNSKDPTYYFRGDVENNYVDFAGFTWRIVRINEDGTIRMIMSKGINNDTKYQFNPKNYDNYMYYSQNSNAKSVLENWYSTSLQSYDNYLATENYCDELKVKFDSSWTTGNAVAALYSEYDVTFECNKDGNGYGLNSLKIGLITYDEVIYAGGYYNQTNSNYYLYNNTSYALMTPVGKDSSGERISQVLSGGHIDYTIANNSLILRPVINLKADTVVTGSGTSTDPYKVKVQETDNLTIGHAVTAIDGSKWHVLESSSSDSKYVTLLSDYNLNTDGTYNTTCGRDINSSNYCSGRVFDSNNTNTYDETDSNNIAYFIKNTYEPLVNESLPGTTDVTIPTANQVVEADSQTFTGASVNWSGNNKWINTTNYWTKTSVSNSNTNVWSVIGSSLFSRAANTTYYDGVRPVITTIKSNLIYE